MKRREPWGWTRRLAVATALGAGSVAGLAGAPAALSATACPARTITTPFTAWGDTNSYFKLDQADFEGSFSAWWLSGAYSVGENEPWRINGSADTKSMAVPNWGSVTIYSVCVAKNEDSFRFFAKAPGLSTAKLSIQTTVDNGTYKGTANYTLSSSASGWLVSPRFKFPDVYDANDTEWVQITIQNQGGGTWYLDDIMIDPWRTA